MWQFEFEAPPGARLHRYFISATIYSSDPTLWWSHEKEKFVEFEDIGDEGASTHSHPIRTFKAFKRFLRKHPELVDFEVVLVSRFERQNIIARYFGG